MCRNDAAGVIQEAASDGEQQNTSGWNLQSPIQHRNAYLSQIIDAF